MAATTENKRTQSSAQNKTAVAIMIFCSEFCNSLSCMYGCSFEELGDQTSSPMHGSTHNPICYIVLVSFVVYFMLNSRRLLRLLFASLPELERIPSYFSNAHKYSAVLTKECFGFTRLLVCSYWRHCRRNIVSTSAHTHTHADMACVCFRCAEGGDKQQCLVCSMTA